MLKRKEIEGEVLRLLDGKVKSSAEIAKEMGIEVFGREYFRLVDVISGMQERTDNHGAVVSPGKLEYTRPIKQQDGRYKFPLVRRDQEEMLFEKGVLSEKKEIPNLSQIVAEYGFKGSALSSDQIISALRLTDQKNSS